MRTILKFALTNVEELAFVIIALYIIYSMWPDLFFPSLLVSALGFGIFVIAKWQILKDSLTEEHYKYDVVGEVGMTTEVLSPEGHIRVKGELWKARSLNGKGIPRGEKVKVERRVGNKLYVTRLKADERNE